MIHCIHNLHVYTTEHLFSFFLHKSPPQILSQWFWWAPWTISSLIQSNISMQSRIHPSVWRQNSLKDCMRERDRLFNVVIRTHILWVDTLGRREDQKDDNERYPCASSNADWHVPPTKSERSWDELVPPGCNTEEYGHSIGSVKTYNRRSDQQGNKIIRIIGLSFGLPCQRR